MPMPIFLDTEGEPIFNAGFSLEEAIKNLPAGADRALKRLLSFHRGRKNAKVKKLLINELKPMGFELDDRQFRILINKFRKEGFPVCSTGGIKGGYWISEDHEEIEKFIVNELEGRAFDLLEQAKAMRAWANMKYGRIPPEKQSSFLEMDGVSAYGS